MKPRSEILLSLGAALLVLFSAMVDPLVSASIAVILLFVFFIYNHVSSHHL